MTSKRSRSDTDAFPENFTSNKRRVPDSSDGVTSISPDGEGHFDFEVPSDTKAAILFLKSVVPLTKFEGKIPAIILKHQIYCVVKDKTLVDRQLNKLWEENVIRLFKLTSGSDEFGVLLTDDYISHVKSRVTDSSILLTIDKFVNDVLPSHIDVSISKTVAAGKYKLSEEEITQLVNIGVLTTRDIGSWWLSVPGAGIFMKNFSNGRKALIRMFRQRKYREILEKDLLTRKFDTHSKLGIAYHVYDITGAEIVQSEQRSLKLSKGLTVRAWEPFWPRYQQFKSTTPIERHVETTSGRLLRLDVQSESRARSRR